VSKAKTVSMDHVHKGLPQVVFAAEMERVGMRRTVAFEKRRRIKLKIN
jgi:hypothetical protein